MEFEDLLWRLLDDWRQTKAVEDYGILVAKRNGPALIMPKGIIDRVVDCAHYEKIKNLQDLRRETGWNCPDEIGLPSSLSSQLTGHLLRQYQRQRRRQPFPVTPRRSAVF